MASAPMMPHRAGGGRVAAIRSSVCLASVACRRWSRNSVLSGVSGKDLPALIDAHKDRIGSGAVLLIADTGGKAAVAAGVTEDLTARVSAVDLVKAAVAELGGKGGGGRPDMAQGGGASVENAQNALAAARAVIEG